MTEIETRIEGIKQSVRSLTKENAELRAKNDHAKTLIDQIIRTNQELAADRNKSRTELHDQLAVSARLERENAELAGRLEVQKQSIAVLTAK